MRVRVSPILTFCLNKGRRVIKKARHASRSKRTSAGYFFAFFLAPNNTLFFLHLPPFLT